LLQYIDIKYLDIIYIILIQNMYNAATMLKYKGKGNPVTGPGGPIGRVEV
jgi:hypothetical protein